jgi:hypothetical protein
MSVRKVPKQQKTPTPKNGRSLKIALLWAMRDSNSQLSPCKEDTLPLS